MFALGYTLTYVVLAAFLILQSLYAGTVTAQELYRWVDDKGTVHFTDNFPSIPEKYRDKVEKRSLLAPRTSPIPAQQSQPVSQSKGIVVPFTRSGNSILVDVLINGRGPVKLVLDTGADVTMLAWGDAKKLGMNPERGDPIRVYGVGAENIVSMVEIDSLKTGDAEVRNMEVTVHPGYKEGGLLGMDFLSDFRMDINHAQNQLTLEPQPRPHEGHSFLWWQQKFRFWQEEKANLQRLFSSSQQERVRAIAKVALEFVNRKINDLEIGASRGGIPREFRE